MTKTEWRRRQAVARYWIGKMREILGKRSLQQKERFLQQPLL